MSCSITAERLYGPLNTKLPLILLGDPSGFLNISSLSPTHFAALQRPVTKFCGVGFKAEGRGIETILLFSFFLFLYICNSTYFFLFVCYYL
jgi:hypothetical protein